MNCLLSPIVLLFLLSAVLGSYGKEKSENEHIQDFLNRLTSSSYDKRIPPESTDGPGEAIKVNVSTYILDIHKVDDSSMDFTAEFYFRQKWKDLRLKFEQPLEYINMRENFEKIWTPDLFFVEERQGFLHQLVNPNSFNRIFPDGTVLFSVKLSVKFGCPMDLRYYPHDIQKCLINVESYGHVREAILLNWITPTDYGPLEYSENITMLEFDLIAATPTVKEHFLKFGNYSNLGINLTFKRKIGFFVNRLYVPFIILVLMTSLSLWIKAEERCLRLSLLLVILYLMVSISTSMNSLIPHAPYTKASDVWIGFCQSLVFAAFLEFIIVAVIAGKESEEGESKGKELLLTLDPEAKEHKLSSDSPKSPLTRMVNFVRRGGSENNLSYRIDKICRIVFPVIFVFFNIVYWSVYCCSA